MVSFPLTDPGRRFFSGKHAGRKEIKRLSVADQAIIKELEPWRGGNNLLSGDLFVGESRPGRVRVGQFAVLT